MSRTDIIVIPHGCSEGIFAKSIKKALKLPIELFDPFKGERDIAIGNVMTVMTGNGFSDEISLHRLLPDLQYNSRRNPRMGNLAVFPILDIDSYKHEKKAYITGNLFRDSPFAGRIHPIFNDGNMDDVLKSLGYKINTVGTNKITSYHEIFDHMMASDFIKLSEELKTIPDRTNLFNFIDFCLSQRPEFQNKIKCPF